MRTCVNGDLRQEASTADMIANFYDLIAELSAACTLNPGNIILTVTPGGSGIFRNPPAGLIVGDVVKVKIRGIGAIENRVVDEPSIDKHASDVFAQAL
jgi:2-keto-4-pentenoate hydratase/2-oxohepta-3-ene-1,7-dioic acid hydratase in catechol pathway